MMSWATLLQPDLVLGGPILHLTPDILKQHHIEGLVLDVDETLVPIKTAAVSDALHTWVQQTRDVVSIWLVSNNVSDSRIGGIAQTLELPYLIGAVKPSRRKLRQAVNAMGLPAERVAMVGDRLFTDVLAGNRLGMFTVLVDPMVSPGDVASKYPLRSFEVWVSQMMGATLKLDPERTPPSEASEAET